jgi:hypothetical protein
MQRPDVNTAGPIASGFKFQGGFFSGVVSSSMVPIVTVNCAKTSRSASQTAANLLDFTKNLHFD